MHITYKNKAIVTETTYELNYQNALDVIAALKHSGKYRPIDNKKENIEPLKKRKKIHEYESYRATYRTKNKKRVRITYNFVIEIYEGKEDYERFYKPYLAYLTVIQTMEIFYT